MIGVVAGVVTLGLGIVDPSLAADASERAQSVTDWLTSLAGVVGAAGGVLALLHLTADKPADQAPPAVPDDGTAVISDPDVTNPSPDFTPDA
ncbi:hypothetical protein GCM10025864_44630 [Luteimicrobium album]|uniref:Uncharacterized protein n=1 Tax=Luteimicrobium album TaxID=1054550 RepID=A0ABQ6IAH8_9MICO|nr:hypothetical protein GCM10025864_00570 [Luteimicrobium album]GMA26704.1 hypothetical protein GCM10025864_44630 [Luteimicrobium album]